MVDIISNLKETIGAMESLIGVGGAKEEELKRNIVLKKYELITALLKQGKALKAPQEGADNDEED